MKNKKKSELVKLFFSVFKLSACTFGGGFVIVPLMRKRFVEELSWIEEQEMLDMTAIAQSSLYGASPPVNEAKARPLIPELHLVQPRIYPPFSQQFFMCPFFCNPMIRHDQYTLCIADRRQPVRNHKGGSVFCQILH